MSPGGQLLVSLDTGSQCDAAPLDEVARREAASKPAANNPQIDRGLAAHLPREMQEHRPATSGTHHDASGQPCGCSACGGRLRRIGVDVSEHLEYVPARFKVIRTVRPKLACTKCQMIFQTAAPLRRSAAAWRAPACLRT